ncbi:hypothetical protein [Methanococcus maripaludis]|uniref:Uncharacterized protein n=1 Tax=Methanococcus maripaludis TaxID=39152 RepID=A0A2L1CAL5_METMI|nr:hypothetical protein [Methanococcus maripaludis]AVB75916.1 hypothetical protein MMJJ_04990 [Methanococcus maripaludis]
MEMKNLQDLLMEKIYLEYINGKKTLSQSEFKYLGVDNDDIYIALKDLCYENKIDLKAQRTTMGVYYFTELTANGIKSVENPKFTKKQVEKAKKIINENSALVMNSKYQTHQNNIKILLDEFENDPVLRHIMLKLKIIDYDFDSWYSETTSTMSSMVASARYELPSNKDKRLSLLYKFLKAISEGKLKAYNFSLMALSGDKNLDTLTDVFNEQIFVHFYNGILSKLEIILEEIEITGVNVENVTINSNIQNSIFKNNEFSLNNKLVFILCPFEDVFNVVCADHIKPLMTSLDLDCMRADDIFDTKPIIEDIWKCINEARIIIADLTHRNPNVFYELGLAHALGKEVITITQNIADIPFDVRHMRIIEYSYTPRGVEKLQNDLKKTIETILNRT